MFNSAKNRYMLVIKSKLLNRNELKIVFTDWTDDEAKVRAEEILKIWEQPEHKLFKLEEIKLQLKVALDNNLREQYNRRQDEQK